MEDDPERQPPFTHRRRGGGAISESREIPRVRFELAGWKKGKQKGNCFYIPSHAMGVFGVVICVNHYYSTHVLIISAEVRSSMVRPFR